VGFASTSEEEALIDDPHAHQFFQDWFKYLYERNQEIEDEEKKTKRKAAAPQQIHRGVAIAWTPELKKKVQEGLDWGDDWNPQFKHFSIGPAILDHMEKTHGGAEQHAPGLGTYWTFDPEFADSAMRSTMDMNQLGSSALPVILSADHPGDDAVDWSEETGMNRPSHNWIGDQEQVLKGGTPLNIRSVKIPMQDGYGRGKWMEVFSEPDNPDWGHLSNKPQIRTATAYYDNKAVAPEDMHESWTTDVTNVGGGLDVPS
jgi:hypothetical protein